MVKVVTALFHEGKSEFSFLGQLRHGRLRLPVRQRALAESPDVAASLDGVHGLGSLVTHQLLGHVLSQINEAGIRIINEQQSRQSLICHLQQAAGWTDGCVDNPVVVQPLEREKEWPKHIRSKLTTDPGCKEGRSGSRAAKETMDWCVSVMAASTPWSSVAMWYRTIELWLFPLPNMSISPSRSSTPLTC
jgi:hypothetical protein